MTPYYDKDGATIYLGDSLEVLRALRPSLIGQVNAIVMDPPYASGARTEAGKRASGAMQRGEAWSDKPIFNDEMTTQGFVWLMRAIAVESREMMVFGGSMLSFIDWRQWPNLVGAVECAGWRIQMMIVWDKLSSALGLGYRNRHELVLHASIGVPTVEHGRGSNVVKHELQVAEHKRERNTVHPSMKPVGLMRELVSVVAPVGGLVVDPFMGAGATLLACRDLGVRAIGIEVVEEYAEAAAKRLDGFTPANETGTDAWQGGLGL